MRHLFSKYYKCNTNKNDQLEVQADTGEEYEVMFEVTGNNRYVFLDSDQVEEIRDFLTDFLEGSNLEEEDDG